jgi:hypothetical protein
MSRANSFRDLLPILHPLLSGCPQPLQLHTLISTARTLCMQTHIWTKDIHLPIVAYQTEYTLPSGDDLDDGVPHEIAWLKCGGVEQHEADYWMEDETALMFDPHNVPDEDTDVADFDAGAAYSAGDYVRYDSKYYQARDAVAAGAWDGTEWQETHDQGIVCNIVLRPPLFDSKIPGWLLDRFGEGIAAGALAELMMQPGKPWTDQNTAAAVWIPKWDNCKEDAARQAYRRGTARRFCISG